MEGVRLAGPAGGSSSIEIKRTRGSAAAIARTIAAVRSVLRSSTTRISRFGYVWAQTEARQSARVASSSLAGMMAVTSGGSATCSAASRRSGCRASKMIVITR